MDGSGLGFSMSFSASSSSPEQEADEDSEDISTVKVQYALSSVRTQRRGPDVPGGTKKCDMMALYNLLCSLFGSKMGNSNSCYDSICSEGCLGSTKDENRKPASRHMR